MATQATSMGQKLAVSVQAPTHLVYNASVLGIGGQSVRLRITNLGREPVSLRNLSITFSATRNGVAFDCAQPSVLPLGERARDSLAAGESMEVSREIPCTMPLVGSYSIDVFAQTSASAARQRVATFRLELEASALVPHPIGEVFAIMSGGNATRPLSPEAWKQGDYHVVLAFINGAPHAARVDATTIVFWVYKKGSPYPCMSEARSLVLPKELAPGAVHLTQVPIACAPSEEGQYEVVGRLSSASGEEIEVGRFVLRVTRDPLLFTPLPLVP